MNGYKTSQDSLNIIFYIGLYIKVLTLLAGLQTIFMTLPSHKSFVLPKASLLD